MKRYHWICLTAVAAVVLLAVPAWASEAESSWRPIWNQVWRILNFLILAFLLVKYGRQPLMGFLAGQKEKLAEEIREMEEAKAEAEAELKVIEDRMAGLAAELQQYEEMVAQQAAKEREDLLQSARYEVDAILERTARQSEMTLENARGQMKKELIELATEDALIILRDAVGKEDRHRMLEEFSEQIEKRHAA